MRIHEILEMNTSSISVVIFYVYSLFQVLESIETSKPETTVKKNVKKSAQKKASTKVSDESSGSSDNESSEEEDEVKPRSKSAAKGKMLNSDGIKKRKRMVKETNISGKKRIKPTEPEDNSDSEDRGNVSEDDRSQSSAEKHVKVITCDFVCF